MGVDLYRSETDKRTKQGIRGCAPRLQAASPKPNQNNNNSALDITVKSITMNAVDLASCITEARHEVETDYANGNISETERDWRMNHIMGF